MTGFDLNQLVSRWMYAIMPTVVVRRNVHGNVIDVVVPLSEKWESVHKVINMDSPQAEKHRKKLFGHDAKIKTSSLFGEIALCKRDGMPDYH